MEIANQRAQIINELLQGLESTKELRNQIITNKTTSLCDQQALHYYTSLIETVMSTFNKTITIAKQINNDNVHLELPHSIAGSSPRIHKPRPDFRAHKRRKMMPKSTKIVQVSQEKSISGLQGPLHDGFSWRKYGQKEILGAKFPRGYYRCTHRHSRACLATKQVQRSDQDPSILQVMYKGEHTCHTEPQPEKAQSKPNPAHITETKPQPPLSPNQHLKPHPTIQELLLGLGPEGDLMIEPNVNRTRIFRCFSFNSALLETEPIDNYILDCSLEFASPTTSDSYFPSSPCGNSMPQVEVSVRTSGSDLKDPISGRNSMNNSPIGEMELPLEQWPDLDPNFF